MKYDDTGLNTQKINDTIFSTYILRSCRHSSKSSFWSWLISAFCSAFWMSTILSRLKFSLSTIFM